MKRQGIYMEQKTIKLLFALVRSALTDDTLSKEARAEYTIEQLPEMANVAKQHDILHLLALGLQKNGLQSAQTSKIEQSIFKAVYRYEQLSYEYTSLCEVLETAKIPFLPLKGSILRHYYPEAWMRTSCDVDVLVRREHVEAAVACLTEKLQYKETERATHDVSLYSQSGSHIELHFDLVEEDRAQNATQILNTVWDDVSLREGSAYHYQMTDVFFYFYHIAHMAKHFETGGCGIRPLIDLWILDNMQGVDVQKRDELLEKGGLLQFATVSRKLSAVWMNGEEADALSLQMQNFIFSGGVYGTAANRVTLQQKKHGGKIGYIFSRMFVPYERLKRYYPILEKHRWLMPFMQVRRWFMLLNPRIRQMAKKELKTNGKMDKETAAEMHAFLDNIGL